MARKYKYGVPVGKSGCRFVLRGGFSSPRSFRLSSGGYAAAVRAARAEVTMGQVNIGIDLVCGPDISRTEGGRRIALSDCYRDVKGRPECFVVIFGRNDFDPPIAGLRRRGRR